MVALHHLRAATVYSAYQPVRRGQIKDYKHKGTLKGKVNFIQFQKTNDIGVSHSAT
jgi:hypothetical protein